MDTLLLKNSEVASLIDVDDIVANVEEGYRNFSRGLVVQPDILVIHDPRSTSYKGADFKVGLDAGTGFYSMKSSFGGFNENVEKGLPVGMNMVSLFDAETASLVCLMEGNYIRNVRTAAAAVIGIKYLSRKDAHSYFAYGAGRIGRDALRLTARVRDIHDVYVFGYMEGEIEQYIADMSKEFPNMTFHACETPEEGARNADIIVTVTLARKGPAIFKEWLKPGTHLSCIGADGPDKQEIDASILGVAKLVNDSIAYASKNGETHHGIEEGYITLEDIHAEIGEVILGTKPGRENDEEITVFDTVGMAVQDMGMALSIYRKAQEQGVGTTIDFYG